MQAELRNKKGFSYRWGKFAFVRIMQTCGAEPKTDMSKLLAENPGMVYIKDIS